MHSPSISEYGSLAREFVINHGPQTKSTLARLVVVMSTLTNDENIVLAGFRYSAMTSARLTNVRPADPDPFESAGLMVTSRTVSRVLSKSDRGFTI
jgi:hypothetical protein